MSKEAITDDDLIDLAERYLNAALGTGIADASNHSCLRSIAASQIVIARRAAGYSVSDEPTELPKPNLPRKIR